MPVVIFLCFFAFNS